MKENAGCTVLYKWRGLENGAVRDSSDSFFWRDYKYVGRARGMNTGDDDCSLNMLSFRCFKDIQVMEEEKGAL